MSTSVQQLTSGPSINNVVIVPAHMAGLVVADDILMSQAQMRLAGARVAEAARAQHNIRQPRHLLNLPASMPLTADSSHSLDRRQLPSLSLGV